MDSATATNITSIIIALITSLGTLLGVVTTVRKGNTTNAQELKSEINLVKHEMKSQFDLYGQSVDMRIAEVHKSIDDLTTEQKKYNNLQARMYACESAQSLMSQRQDMLEKTIGEIKG